MKLTRRAFLFLTGSTGMAMAAEPGRLTVERLIPYVIPPEKSRPGWAVRSPGNGNSALFPDDLQAWRVRHGSLLLGEFIEKRQLELPRLQGRAVYHDHCHQKAVLDAGAGRRVLAKMGLELEEPQPGCCGMAGAFGLEKGHYEVSMRIAEENLLPAVRAADEGTWVLADGYIPGDSTGPQPEMLSHETCCLLNVADQSAKIELTIFFSDREPAGPYCLTVPGRRTLHLRFNDLEDPEPIPRDTDYACLIESDVPIVVQHTRLDSRQAANALISTMAFPAD